jgi:hypothetical protein
VSRETFARGFTGLRAAGDMGWAARADVDRDQLVAYEAGLTPLMPALRFTAMCEYDRAVFAGAVLEQLPERVLAAHPLVVLPKPGSLHASLDASWEGDVLRLAGDADLATRGAFEQAVRLPGPAVIDLTGLAFIDAYCVRVLLRLGGGVRLECTAAQARLLGLCGAARDGMVRVRTG